MYKRKRFSAIPILAFIVILLGILIFSGVIGSPRKIFTTVGANEDMLSLTTVPKDVSSAENKAKTTGIPNQGIRADGPEYNVPVLMYHYVEYVADKGDTIRQSLDVTPSTFESQIKTLKSAGYTFITASDLANILDGILLPPQKPVLLTFDDGHRDFFTDVVPILRKYNIKATIFIITGFLDESDFLTTAELKEIAKSGLVEIGDHTIHHLALAKLSNERVKKEIEDSKIQLEGVIGMPVTTFAYPYGSFDLQAIQILKGAGFRTGFSVVPGNRLSNANRFFVDRIRPGGATGKGLLNLIQKTNW